MYEITLTPAATLGLFLAHRRHKSDTVPGLRASIDAERWFLGKDPLVENCLPRTASEGTDLVAEHRKT